jgi:hypothetical protein
MQTEPNIEVALTDAVADRCVRALSFVGLG